MRSLWLVVFLASCSGPSQTPKGASSVASEGALQQIAWHEQRLARLRAEDGWLTLVGLDFLEDGTHTVGSGEGVRLRYAGCSRSVIGRFEVRGTKVRFHREAGSEVSIENGTEGEPLMPDSLGSAAVVRDGPVSFTLVRRNARLALRVRDNNSPIRAQFRGIELFPYDPSWRVPARWIPAMPGQSIAITNVTGFTENQALAGYLEFEHEGRSARLLATPESSNRVSVIFGDASNASLTYGGGRFLSVELGDDTLTYLDFNQAYNPPCSFTHFATCPLPPPENRLPFAVPAGERRYQ